MTPAEQVAVGLAERFEVDVLKLARKPVFRVAAERACALMPPEKVVAQVAEDGGLAGARDPYAVIIDRLRRLPALEVEGRHLTEDRDQGRRRRRVEVANRCGERLRALVVSGRLPACEAVETITCQFADDDLRAVAVAALEGNAG